MVKTKPPKRKPPTQKQILDYLQAHGHKTPDVAKLSNAKDAKEISLAVKELHKAKQR